MLRAFIMLALVAVLCVFAHAEHMESPDAKAMEHMLNGVQEVLLSSPLQQELDESTKAEAEKYQDAVQAASTPDAQWSVDVGEHSFAQQSDGINTAVDAEVDVDMDSFGGFDKPAKSSAKSSKPKAKRPEDPRKIALKKFFGGVVSKPSTVKGPSGNIVEALRITTGAVGSPNSQCFTCQYYLQRTLGALLGPFYHPVAAGAPAPTFEAPQSPFVPTNSALGRWSRPTLTAGAHDNIGHVPTGSFPRSELILAEVGAEVDVDVEAEVDVDAEVDTEVDVEDEVSFLEIESLVKESFPVPTAEEALEQYNKWKAFLPAHMSMIEADAEITAEPKKNKLAHKIGDSPIRNSPPKGSERFKKPGKKALKMIADQKAKARLARKKRLSRKARGLKFDKRMSVKSRIGRFYGKVEMGAIRTFFSNLCHRRTPQEFVPVCRGIWKKLDLIVEELAVGDRPDEVCIRHNFCPVNSYVTARAHTTVRKNDD